MSNIEELIPSFNADARQMAPALSIQFQVRAILPPLVHKQLLAIRDGIDFLGPLDIIDEDNSLQLEEKLRHRATLPWLRDPKE